eukprot:TRINITY_DN7351_c0_g1_i1.p1 TRINITY_DN7351_c0_g1~~TRINITY_DN7351_c0_g1_i1.p1  ORF type:complete len:327 (+),score=115.10 TRINITY_DN7351_c0_g1_i1:73-1053(+)
MLSDYPDLKLATTDYSELRKGEDDNNKPIQNVQVDGLVVLKILQHAKEYCPQLVSGHCMGIGSGKTLEITHSFALPARSAEDEETETEANQDKEYQDKIQKMLRNVNVDVFIVGFYAITWQESHFSDTFIQTMYLYQSELGEHSVCLLFDPLKSLQGKLHLKALRLKPEFMKMLADNQDKADFSQNIINSYGVTSSDIFHEVPVVIRNCHLIDEFLWELGTSKEYGKETIEDNAVCSDMVLTEYQTLSATKMVEATEQTLSELSKYMNIVRRGKLNPDEEHPSRLETLYLTSVISNLSRHMCDVSHIAFESVSLCEALQQAQRARN